jgi:hypothetical protein
VTHDSPWPILIVLIAGCTAVTALTLSAIREERQRRGLPTSDHIPPRFGLGCLVAVCGAVIGGSVLLGLPGMVILGAATAPLELVGFHPMARLYPTAKTSDPEAVWGLALIISVLWLAPFPFASHLFYKRWPNAPTIWRRVAALLSCFSFGILVAYALLATT